MKASSSSSIAKTPDPLCAYCGGPLGGDPRPDAATGRMYCCYGCRILGATGVESGERLADSQPWFRIGAGALLAGQAMVLGLTANLSQPVGLVRWAIHGGLIASALGVLALLGFPLVRQACGCVRDRRLAIEWLFVAGILGAFSASLWSTFTGAGAVYYEVVAVLVTVYAAGKALTAAARERAFAETRRLRDLFSKARRHRGDGSSIIVAAAEIAAGDYVAVFPGEGIPIDGVVVKGAALVRETPLTGEPRPVVRRAGDEVLAGSFTEDGELEIRATGDGRARRLDEVLAGVEAARGSLAETWSQSEADRIAAAFLPLVLGLAAVTFTWWVAKGHPGDALFNALSVLLVACPCAMGLATPLALWHALASLAARGILVRSAAALERAGGITEVFFDKTGTLSEPGPELVDFVCEGGAAQRTRLLEWAAAIEERSSHPFAQAFRRGRAGARGDTKTHPVRPGSGTGAEVMAFKAVPACGVEAWIRTASGSEFRVQLGSREWIAGTSTVPWADELRASPNCPVVAMAVDGKWVALGAIREAARPGVAQAMAELRALGCRVRVLSGDRTERVGEFIRGLGIDAAAGGLTPAAKTHLVEEAQARGGRVAMVGDGVNDAPALRAADLGVAVGGSAPIAEAAADVVLAAGDLTGVALVIRLSRQVRASIRSSLWFAAFYNSLGMALAAAGLLHPVVAALLMVGSSAVVSWRALHPGEGHCAAPRPASPPSGLTWQNLWIAASFILQIPLVGWLGQVSSSASWAIGAVLLAAAGLSITSVISRSGVGRVSLAMLGPGNLLMLVGWWIDAGFGPVMQKGVCLCCQSHHYFEPGGHIPWMYVGMLAGGLPFMWPGLQSWDLRLGRWPILVLSSLGMVAGMAWGAEWVLRWAGPGHPFQFVLALGGMSAGMLCGMFFACALGEAAVRARKL